MKRAAEDRTASWLLWTVLGTFGAYIATAPAIAHFASSSLLTAPVWSASGSYPDWSRPIVLLFGLAGVAIALFVPALPWANFFAGTNLRTASLFHRAFAINLLQAVIVLSVSKALTGEVPSRLFFIAWQAAVAATGFVALARGPARAASFERDGMRPLLTGIAVLLVLLPMFLWSKTFVEDGSGDGTEAFEFARSLAKHQLPHWDLENGYFGFYPQFMLFAYPLQLAFLALGEGEAAQRLPVYFYLLGTYLVLAELVRGRRRRLAWIEIGLLVGAAVSCFLYHGFHSTYELVADLAEPLGVDVFFSFVFASALYSLIARQRLWWGLFALFGTMSLAAGVPFAGLLLAGRALATRRSWRVVRDHVWDALAFGAPWLAYQVFVHVYSRFHPLGTTKFSSENFLSLYPVDMSFTASGIVLVNFVWVVALVPALGLAVAWRSDAIARMLTLPVLGYGVLLVIFARVHPHYLIPLTLLPGAILLRSLAGRSTASLWYGAYGVALTALAIFAVPRDLAPHTAYRDFARTTLLRHDSYRELIDAALVVVEGGPEFAEWEIAELAMPWQRSQELFANRRPLQAAALHGFSHHLWARYADRTPVPGRSYDRVLMSSQLAPPQMDGYERREPLAGWALFSRLGHSDLDLERTRKTTWSIVDSSSKRRAR